jgi:uncharacterized iron-regulated membrane protein
MRSLLLVVHRYVALVAALVVLVIALTGSALVFEGAIDRALNPQLWRAAPVGPVLPLDTHAAQDAAAARGTVGVLSLARNPGVAYVAQSGASQVFVNPYTGAVLGTRTIAEWNRTLPRRIHVLHTTLLAGRTGGAVVGAVTVAVLFLVLSGLWLWWPDKLWRVRWSGSWKRVVFDLHHAAGVFAAVVLLAITGSGLVMHYRSLGGLIARLDASPPARAPAIAGHDSTARTIGFDSVRAVAQAALPGAIPMVVEAEPGGAQPDVVLMRFPEDRTPAGRSRVFVDPYTGSVLLAVSTRTAETGTRISNLVRSVHTGDLFGKPTEAIWLLATLVLASQAVTGALMWWNGRRARAAARRRAVSGT